MKNIEKAYKEILDALNKHKDLICFDVDDLERQYKIHLFGIKLKEKYGLDIKIEDVRSLDYNKLGEYMSIGMWGEKHNREISFEDSGKQPEDELLLKIGFPTGAYIFGNDYPSDFFQQFFMELKSYKPKYIDTTNKCLYFDMDNAKDVFNNFRSILRKYKEMNEEDAKQREITRLKKQLEKLNAE